MKIEDLYNKFLLMEEEKELFYRQEIGIYYWDVIRHSVFMAIYNENYNIKREVATKISLKNKFKMISNEILFFLKVLCNKYDYIALISERNRRESEVYDSFMDPILNTLSGKVLELSLFMLNEIKYGKNYQILLRIIKKIYYKVNKKRIDSVFQALNNEINDYFGLNIDIKQLMIKGILEFKIEEKYYLRLLKLVKPKKIFVTQDNIQKAIMQVANKLDIPILEIQHGDASYYHPLYHYSPNINYEHIKTLPKYFLTFSSYWGEQYPCEKIVIGKQICNGNSKDVISNEKTICFILSLGNEEVLLQLAIAVAIILDDFSVYIKLHPYQINKLNEFRVKTQIYKNIYIVAIYEEFTKTLGYIENFVCIKSTCVFEALQCNKKVFILKTMDYDYFSYAFNNNVYLIEDEKGIIDNIYNKPQKYNLNYYDFNKKVDEIIMLE